MTEFLDSCDHEPKGQIRLYQIILDYIILDHVRLDLIVSSTYEMGCGGMPRDSSRYRKEKKKEKFGRPDQTAASGNENVLKK